MSTPLREHNRHHNRSSLLSPGGSRLIKNRYCVSDTSSPNAKALNNFSPGPLLTPTNYNKNLSTYIDCKSPGLSSRIVQYSGEVADKSEPFILHQAKYNSPGIFPIVHLQKKNLPVRKIPREIVTVRLIAPHDSPINGLKTNGIHNDNDTSDASTSNVLKALREISKKRMLSEEITSPQNNNHKRHRSDCHIETPQNHINLDSSSTVSVNNTSSKKSTDNIPCVVDALAASLTSSNTGLANSRKRKSAEKPAAKNVKQACIEVETQTENLKVSNVTQTTEEIKPQELTPTKNKPASGSLININTRIYENVLNNKLTRALIEFDGEKLESSSSSNASPLLPGSILSPPNKPKHDKHVTFNLPDNSVNETASTMFQPLSVITNEKVPLTTPTPLNSPNLPDEMPILSDVTVPPSIIPFEGVTTTLSFTSAKFESPSVATVVPPKLLSFMPSTTTFPLVEKPAVTSLVAFGSSTSEQKPVNDQPTFASASTITSNLFNNDTTIAPITFGAGALTPQKPASAPPTILSQTNQKSPEKFKTSPSKLGGFKFDLVVPSTQSLSVAHSTVVSPFSFGNAKPATNLNFGANTQVTSTYGPSTISSTGFDIKTAASNVSMPAIELPQSQTADITQPSTGFGFGATNEPKVPSQTVTTNANGFKFTPAPTTAAPSLPFSTPTATSNTFQFSANATTAPSMFSTPFSSSGANVTTASLMFSTSSANVTTASSMFSIPSANVTTASSMFSTPPFSTSNANVTTAPSMFSTSFSSSGANATVTPSMFNTSSTNATVAPSMFNASFSSANANTTPSMFKSPSNELDTFKFGSSSGPFKDSKQQSSEPANAFKFGATSTASTFTAPIFNNVQSNDTNNAFKFGGSTGGLTNQTNTFKPPNLTTEANAFKFGSSTTTDEASKTPFKFNPTNNTTGSGFNQTVFNSSGQTNNDQNLFKFNSTVTTASGQMFNTPTFNLTTASMPNPPPPSFPTTTSGFGAFGSFESKPANPFNASGFGEPKSGPFGGAPQTFNVDNNKPASLFGAQTQNKNAFGTFNNGQTSFGAQAGASQPSFGAPSTLQLGTNPPSFGAPSILPATNQTPFGAPTNQPAFGATSTNQTGTNQPFGAPSTLQARTSQPSFGAPSTLQAGTHQPSFGAPSTLQAAANQTPFGASSTLQVGTNQPSFGAPSTLQAGTNQTQFGAPSTLQAGTNQPSFGAPSALQAGANQPLFGAAAPIQSASAQPFQFGASTNQPASVFSFGASNDPAKSTTANLPNSVFSFGANANNNNAFGSVPAPSFGAVSNNFGMQPPAVPNFGAQMQGAPMFSIGAGSSTPKQRTQLKARRRT